MLQLNSLATPWISKMDVESLLGEEVFRTETENTWGDGCAANHGRQWFYGEKSY